MEKEDQEPGQSSLPSSLIPHLYSRPQHPRDTVLNPSATNYAIPPAMREEGTGSANDSAQFVQLTPPSPATTTGLSFIGGHSSPRFYSSYLPIDSEAPSQGPYMVEPSDGRTSRIRRTIDMPNVSSDGQRYPSPIYSDPVYHASRTAPFRPGQAYSLPSSLPREQISRPTWREWKEREPGPSSLNLPRSFPHPSMGSNNISQQSEAFHRPTWPEGHAELYSRGDPTQTESSRHSLRPGMIAPIQRLYDTQSSQQIQELPPPHALFPGSEAPSSVIYGRGHEGSLTSVSQRSWPSEKSAHDTGLLPALVPIKTETSQESRIIGKAEGEDGFKPVQRGKKRRGDPAETESRTEKAGNPRKTAVACNFCRGRKLRCNGARPSCHNCTVRKLECEYVPMQRRRGPGKANKGLKSSKRAQQVGPSSEEGPTVNSPPSTNDQELGDSVFGLDATSPRQSYTSMMSLETFAFQPPGSSSGASVGAEMEPQRPESRDGYS